jgi:hypothetical protein
MSGNFIENELRTGHKSLKYLAISRVPQPLSSLAMVTAMTATMFSPQQSFFKNRMAQRSITRRQQPTNLRCCDGS